MSARQPVDAVVLEVLGDFVDRDSFAPETPLLENGLVDSVALVEIVATLEERLSVEIPPELLVPETFESAESLARVLESLLSSKRARL